MQVNKKKSIRLKNRTVYFNPETSKTHVQFSSPETYQNRQIKIEGYETRLYWQFRYCEEHNGQTFFYTLTYNDKAMPKYMGINCFDYEHLRDLLTGGFRKQLLRKYGTTFKYFIGAELGDGKGERGMHNNPHYHVLFFLEDAKNERYPYQQITPEDFRHYIRAYWQGFDEDKDGFHDYNDAKYGIAREGDNLGKVTDYRACMYCAKYVCKDVKLRMYETEVEKKLRFKYKNDKYPEECCRRFFFEKLVPMYTQFHNRTPQEVMEHLCPDAFEIWKMLDGDDYDINTISLGDDYNCFHIDVLSILRSHKRLWNKYFKFYKEWLDEQVRLGINEYRNRYCNKCRISQGVGDYALEHIDDKFNPTIQVPSKKGFKNRPLAMYYYRKLYTEVVKDEYGSNIRVLNQAGIDYKVCRLPQQIKKKADLAQSHLDVILNSPKLYENMVKSDINTQVFWSYNEFLAEYNYLLLDNNNDLKDILTRYGQYKLVYEDRFLRVEDNRTGVFGVFPDVDYLSDYRRFLNPAFYTVNRSDTGASDFLANPGEAWFPYYAHPYFLRYVRLFSVLDLCADYFFIQGDNQAQADAEERARIKRFHDREKLKEFYGLFRR